MSAKEPEKTRLAVTDKSQLYLVGGGIAGLSAAVFAIRDGGLPGKNIHIFEVLEVLGGALEGHITRDKKCFTRGDWKFNIEAYQCMWDVLSSIPSLTVPNQSVKEEIFEYNRTHKKNARSRLIDRNRNVDHVTTMGLSLGQKIKLLQLIFIPESRIENRRIDSWFDPSFFETNFWKVFSSMFAIEHWNDLVEMRRYMRRFMHDFYRMVQGGGEVVTPHHNHDTMIRPMIKWLSERGVEFMMGCKVMDLDFKPSTDELTVEKIHYVQNGQEKEIAVHDGDFVFVTNGSMTADSRSGSMTEPPALETRKLDGSWTLWENIAKKRPGLGNPSVFNGDINKSKWITFVVTATDPTFLNLYEKFTGNKPGQADMVTFRDSSWHMSVLVMHQPHFLDQPEGVYFWGGCGLLPDKTGDYVNIEMTECNGRDILTEVCHHFGFIDELPHILETSTCIPNMMPYEMSHFLPRKRSDRPQVVPERSTNLAFMGQFVESGECVMLVESSVRCAKMAVYDLFKVDKEVPPPYTATRNLLVWPKVIATLFK
jgi:oleate hydratase